MANNQKNLMQVSYTLDVRGESCPYPEMYTLDAIKEMQPGEIIEVVADCPQSFINVPESVKKHGHQLLQEVKDGTTRYFYIEVK